MNVKQLKQILDNYPDDMEIWVSDNGYYEGGERLSTVNKLLAVDAGLDGDEIDDEYMYIEEDTDIVAHMANGYLLNRDGDALSKQILYLNDMYSRDNTK